MFRASDKTELRLGSARSGIDYIIPGGEVATWRKSRSQGDGTSGPSVDHKRSRIAGLNDSVHDPLTTKQHRLMLLAAAVRGEIHIDGTIHTLDNTAGQTVRAPTFGDRHPRLGDCNGFRRGRWDIRVIGIDATQPKDATFRVNRPRNDFGDGSSTLAAHWGARRNVATVLGVVGSHHVSTSPGCTMWLQTQNVPAHDCCWGCTAFLFINE